MKVSKSIWDVRFSHSKMALDAACKSALAALDEWITIHGAHVEIDGDGNVLHGAGGKFNGTNYYRHMNEKARAEKGEIYNDFNKAEYKEKLKNAINENLPRAEKQAITDRETDFIGWSLAAEIRERDLQKAQDRGLTRRGLMKYERAVKEAHDEMDKLRTPEELMKMAREAPEDLNHPAAAWGKYMQMARDAKKDIEGRTLELLPHYLNEAGLDVKGEISDIRLVSTGGGSSGGGREKAIDNFVTQNANRHWIDRENELSQERAERRIEQLYESGQYPREAGLRSDFRGNIHLGEGNNQIESEEDVRLAMKDYGKPNDAAGQKSIFGGSGWW